MSGVASAECGVLIAARMSAPAGGLAFPGGEPPSDIQWMPPGKHTINALKNSTEPMTLTVTVDSKVAARLAQMLQDARAKAAQGVGDLPYFDFNHDDQEAAGHPTEFFWAGDDPVKGGIRAKVEWTEAGKQALLGKLYRRFSPEFGIDHKTKAISSIGINVGGLVNKAAFKTIQAIWSRDGGDQSANTNKQKGKMKTTEEQLADLVTAVATLTTAVGQIATNVGGIQAKMAAPDPKILVLETGIKNLEQFNQVQAKNQAAALVQAAVKEGKLPPQNAGLIEQWTNLITIDAKNADLLAGLPVNPALKQGLISNPGGAGTGSGATGEHQFIVKAKALAAEKKISEAEAQVELVQSDKALYESYRATVLK